MTAARSKKRSASLGESDDLQLATSASPSDHTPGSGSGSVSATHDNNDDTGAGSNASSAAASAQHLRKRKRRVVSCAECHRRKQKCDRNLPCKACIDRKMEASCHYETVAMSRERHHMRVLEAASYGRALQADSTVPVKAAGFGYAQNPANTLGFLNRLDGGVGNGVAGGGDISGLMGITQYGSGNDNGRETAAGGGGAGGDRRPKGATLASMVSESVSASGVVPTTQAAHAAALTEQQLYYHQQQSTQQGQLIQSKQATALQQQHESHRLIHSQHPSFDHQMHQRPQIGDPSSIADRYRSLVRELPPRPAIDRLADLYFKEFNWNYYAIDEDIFYKQLADWSDIAMGPFCTPQSPLQLSPDLRAFPALLFNVMAMGLIMLEPKKEEDVSLFNEIKHATNATFEDLALDYSETGMAILSLLGKRQMSYTTVLTGFSRAAFLKYVALITEAVCITAPRNIETALSRIHCK